jgi:hypothetical protein
MRKIHLIVYIVFIFLIGCSITQKNPLIGRWQSNKAETIKEIRNCGEYTEKQISLITSKVAFGELILAIDADTITSYYQGSVDTDEYKIISIDLGFVKIESYNNLTNENEIISIEVRSDKMWVPSSLVKFREVFDRIN